MCNPTFSNVYDNFIDRFVYDFSMFAYRYLTGGMSSAFKHVDPNKFERRLFQVKGKKNIRVGQVGRHTVCVCVKMSSACRNQLFAKVVSSTGPLWSGLEYGDHCRWFSLIR